MTAPAGHTPGPWEARGYWSHPDSETLVWDKEAAICHVFPRSEMGVAAEETRRANARLIAQAPDLLAERNRLAALNAELVAALRGMTTAYRAYKESGYKGEIAFAELPALAALAKAVA